MCTRLFRATPRPRTPTGRHLDRKPTPTGGSKIRDGAHRTVTRADNLTLIERPARFVAPHTVEADSTRYQAERIVVNTGARPHIPDIPGLDQVSWLDSTAALDLIDLPGHLIVIGGGYVICEYAQMYRRFGSQVTVIQRADIALLLAGVFLFEGELQVSPPVLWPTALVMGAATTIAGRAALKARLQPSTTGTGTLIGKAGTVVNAEGRIGSVFLDGAWWSVRSSTGDLESGEQARIVGIEGLELIVEPIGADHEH